MKEFTQLRKNLEQNGFLVSEFETGAEATAYLNGKIDGKTVGMGGSMTLKELGVYDALAPHNEVHWHWVNGMDECKVAATAQVYLSSANGVSETGEIINIDGNGNRVASMLYGHETLYLVVGENKIAPTYEQALWRARNIASPKNAVRVGATTPCAVKGDRCYNCKSPKRICRGLTVLWNAMNFMTTEVVLIHEDFGY